MIHFTSYAEKKFDILNRHKVFITKEQVVDAVSVPDKLEKKGNNYFACKDDVCVVYRIECETPCVVTFYPVKTN
jgi:hypothetical protein